MTDWIIHYVSNGHDCACCNCGCSERNPAYYELPGFANVHTHGLAKHGQRELCLPLNIGLKRAAGLLNSMGARVANKETVFTEGTRNDILTNHMNTRLVSFDGDPTLYLILPDASGRLPGDDGCEAPYAYQETYARIISEQESFGHLE